MSWTLRVIRHKNNDPGGDWLAIHEVFMDENGKVFATTQEPESVISDMEEDGGVDGLRLYLGWMLESLDQPILNFDDIPEEGAINPFENITEENLREWV